MSRALAVTALVVSSVALAAAAAGAAIGSSVSACDRTSVGLVPLTDLGRATYKGFAGGLYPRGSNVPPASNLAEGLRASRQVVPRAPNGRALASGRIVLLSIGMSNTTQEFQEFMRKAASDRDTSARVLLVDGAQGGQDAEKIKDPAAPFWSRVEQRLAGAGATAAQVQVVWLKEAIARETRAFPDDARGLESDLRSVVQTLRMRYPNLKLVYLSSRTYGGYATTTLNPEPYAYESGFAVKWLIDERIERQVTGPWLAWGPYLWTDGTKGRRDGLRWTCEDIREDGTHPSPSGQAKVAALLLRFFKTSPTARGWFRSS